MIVVAINQNNLIVAFAQFVCQLKAAKTTAYYYHSLLVGFRNVKAHIRLSYSVLSNYVSGGLRTHYLANSLFCKVTIIVLYFVENGHKRYTKCVFLFF